MDTKKLFTKWMVINLIVICCNLAVVSAEIEVDQSLSKNSTLYLNQDTNQHELLCLVDIRNIGGGILFITAEIHNEGESTAPNVTWSIVLDGGMIFHGRETTGEIPYIPFSEEEPICSEFIVGIGYVNITITAKPDDWHWGETKETVDGFVFGPLIWVN